ncbi:rhamnulokinase family protein [Lacticaseibacillus baoqingensis]|uniref:Rhamnulokinase family protein n=1 Tax=Lacticaseibacillus baoqingensis TaxID=2486013 RepID=A0ABW4E613_9LACO|nr:rhamnulokinase family protein [Lacticaseibacillus baoqingensis]
MKKVLAFDFGASSGRAMLGIYDQGDLSLEEVHRFKNYPLERDGQLFWDIDYLFGEVKVAIQKAQQTHVLDSIGVDTWGVDFGLIGDDGQLLQLPRSYRDPYTAQVLPAVSQHLDLQTLYQRTGNQLMPINTLFQLFATQQAAPKLVAQAQKFLFMPDLFNYLLTGKLFAERSIASTAQMIDPRTGEWAADILAQLAIPQKLLPPLVDAPHLAGVTKPELGFGAIKVINVCEHDTASAVVSVPNNQNFLFISCGTWSLIGTELQAPVITDQAYQYNLTNETGINRTTRFLKNLTGLWIIQELQRNLAAAKRDYSFGELAALADQAPAFQCLIDTDNPLFTAPGPMIPRIRYFAEFTGQTPPTTEGEFVRCIYESLAMKYKLTYMEISAAVKGEFDAINIVGGGSQAAILCQMVADAANSRVIAGPVEATALGNIAVQLLAQGEFKDLKEIRDWLKRYSHTQYYVPNQDCEVWDREFSRYQAICKTAGVDHLVTAYAKEPLV